MAGRARLGGQVERPTVFSYASGFVVLVVGGVLAARAGTGAAELGLTIAAGLVPAFVSVVLPHHAVPASGLVLVGGLVVLAGLDSPAVLAWFGAFGLGAALATQVRWRRREARRPAGARTAPLRTVHDQDGDLVEQVDPSAAQVRELVARLDGRTRSGLSVFRRPARLDVGGDAARSLLVALCEDVTAPRPVWSVATSGPTPVRGDEVALRVAGVDAHLPDDALTTLPSALTALDAFLTSGRADAALPWRTGRGGDDLRAVFDRLD